MPCRRGPNQASCGSAVWFGLMLSAACGGGESAGPTPMATDAGRGGANAAGESGKGDVSERDLSVGLPTAARLSDLAPAQAMQVCEYMQRVRAEAISVVGAERVTCTYRALAAPGVVEGMSVNREVCQAAVDACVAAAAKPEPAARSFSCAASDLSPIWTSCDLMIGALERCITSTIERLDAQYGSFGCESLTSGGPTKAPAGPPESSDACGALFAQCPSLLGIADLPWPVPSAN